jgi:hypothetical protein
VAGIVGDAAATRSGEDGRRRGWFWHWNSIVTQFAPLIGLKGVGLLNSYTVWTDRREESPHRGYAFPSQQREADFYGEDRAELIAINKILVALDLIEIRKEMVLRVDEQGRRWRVPHNFYRVKDHGDGFLLGSRDVLRVVELADRDQTVYRSIRHIFSTRFAPIDADNVWVGILAEVRRADVWQRLAARASREEDRASARTRAGHASRKTGLGTPVDGDTTAPNVPENDSVDVTSEGTATTSVASINNGSIPVVAPANNGFAPPESTVVDPVNREPATSVGRCNRTYDQSRLTTTTNDEIKREDEPRVTAPSADPALKMGRDLEADDLAARTPGVTDKHDGIGPGGRIAPAAVAGEAAAVQVFEDANGRRSTPAERQLLRGLAERFEPAAREQRRPSLPTGWTWLAAAIYEAVEAGSAFVAPRSLREILGRWEREGAPDGGEPVPRRAGEGERSVPAPPPPRLPAGSPPRLGEGPEIALPHGFGSRRTWEFTVALLGGVIERTRLAELVAGTAIVGYAEVEIVLAVPDTAQAERIGGEYRELIARKLSEAMRRPIRLAVVMTKDEGGPPGGSATGGREEQGTDPEREDEEPAAPVFVVVECGLPSGQVWAAVLEDVATDGRIGRANFDAWLRTTSLIGRGEEGSLVVGVPHPLAQRRIAARFAAALQSAAAAIVGVALPLEIVVARDWLRGRQFRPDDNDVSASAAQQRSA